VRAGLNWYFVKQRGLRFNAEWMHFNHSPVGYTAYPTPEKVHLNLGLLYLSQGRQDEAIAEFRRGVEINPKFWRGHYELASALDKAGRLDEAISEYEVAVPDYKGNAEYHYRLGLAYMKDQQAPKAREHLSRCQELAPGSENASKALDLLKMIP